MYLSAFRITGIGGSGILAAETLKKALRQQMVFWIVINLWEEVAAAIFKVEE
jgi:hypothetical protein